MVLAYRNKSAKISSYPRDAFGKALFTIKPTAEGTGLDLSLAYDIVVKGLGGTLELMTERVRDLNLLFVCRCSRQETSSFRMIQNLDTPGLRSNQIERSVTFRVISGLLSLLFNFPAS